MNPTLSDIQGTRTNNEKTYLPQGVLIDKHLGRQTRFASYRIPTRQMPEANIMQGIKNTSLAHLYRSVYNKLIDGSLVMFIQIGET